MSVDKDILTRAKRLLVTAHASPRGDMIVDGIVMAAHEIQRELTRRIAIFDTSLYSLTRIVNSRPVRNAAGLFRDGAAMWGRGRKQRNDSLVGYGLLKMKKGFEGLAEWHETREQTY